MATIIKFNNGVASLKLNKASFIIEEAIVNKVSDSEINEISHFIILESFLNKRGDAISYARVAFYSKDEKLHETVKIDGRDVAIYVWYKTLLASCTQQDVSVQTEETGDIKNIKIFIPKSSNYTLRVIGGSITSEINGEIFIHSLVENSNNKISVR